MAKKKEQAKKKYNISPASAKIKSITTVQSISPSQARTAGFQCTAKQAVSIATGLLAVAADSRDLENVFVTAHHRGGRFFVTVIRRKGKNF